jgi:hypothetical protein
MHTISLLHSFLRAADDAGMTEGEIDSLVDYIAANPAAGDEIAGTGGCRKLRFAAPERGKRGGYRVVTFFTGDLMPVFLITVFKKGDRANLSAAQRNRLGRLTKEIVSEYRAKVVQATKRGA